MLRIGLTGGIASGKSAVADELAAHGAVVIDADVLAREVVEPGTPGLAAILDRFGPEYAPEGRLDRARLGALVFADSAARRDLERIVHPAVRDRAAALEATAPPGAIVVHVVPLLVETGQQDDFDLVIAVETDAETQLSRLMQRNGLSREQAEQRVAAQASAHERRAAADIIVPNRGSMADLKQQIAALWGKLRPTDAPE